MQTDYTKALEGISYDEWLKVQTAMGRYFDEKIRKLHREIKLTDSNDVDTLIRSQFGGKWD